MKQLTSIKTKFYIGDKRYSTFTFKTSVSWINTSKGLGGNFDLFFLGFCNVIRNIDG